MIRLFRHYVPKSLLYLGAFELFVFIASVYIGVVIRFLDNPESVSELTAAKLLIFSVVMLSAMIASGLYQRDLLGGIRSILSRVTISFVIGLSIMAVLFYVGPDLFLGRGVMALAAMSAFGGVLLGRVFFLKYADRAFLKTQVLIIGSGQRAARIEALPTRTALRGLNVVGYVSIGKEHQCVPEERVFPGAVSLADVVYQHNIDEIVVAVDDRRKTFPTDELLHCKMNGVEVIDLVTFLERQTGKIDVGAVHPSSLIFADGYVHTVLKPASKRIFDIAASVGLLAVTWPIMLLAVLAIWAESGFKGSVVYSQTRVGAGGKLFKILKFRSMVEDAEAKGVQWATKNDPRITGVGRFIRTSRIDELPQLYNVIKGNMSFVGPRPERPEFVKQLSEKIPYYRLRHGLKPGITGWAQICFSYGASEEDALEKLQYDLYYMKNYSIFLDLNILFQTMQVILWRKGGR